MALIISILIDYRNLRYGFLILKQEKANRPLPY